MKRAIVIVLGGLMLTLIGTAALPAWKLVS
jgi:hypothetical protein